MTITAPIKFPVYCDTMDFMEKKRASFSPHLLCSYGVQLLVRTLTRNDRQLTHIEMIFTRLGIGKDF